MSGVLPGPISRLPTDGSTMTDQGHSGTRRGDSPSETLVVPGADRAVDDASDEDLISDAQNARDLGSASRSCVAILTVLVLVALLLCVFLFWAFFLQ
jgi:hypothetical protein